MFLKTFFYFLLLIISTAKSISFHTQSTKPTSINKSFLSVSGGEKYSEDNTGSEKHEIVEEKLMYKRWRTLVSRIVRCPDGRVLDFDVVGQAGSNRAVLIFAFNTQTKTATLVREYMPGANQMKYGVAAGLVEKKHVIEGDEDPKMIAARHELEEECHLVGGTWIQLTNDTIMDKYATTVVNVYLVLDAEEAIDPKPLDEEEDIEIISNVSIPDILAMIADGEMNVVGGWASLVAIQKLQEMKLAS